MDEYSRNLALWNEWTQIPARAIPTAWRIFKAGKNKLHELEVGEVGPAAGNFAATAMPLRIGYPVVGRLGAQ